MRRFWRALLTLVVLLVVVVIAALLRGGPVSDSDVSGLRVDGWTSVSVDGMTEFTSPEQRWRAQVSLLADTMVERALRSHGWYSNERFFSDQVGQPRIVRLPWARQLRASRLTIFWVDCPGLDCGADVAQLWYGFSLVEVRLRTIGPSVAREALEDAFRVFVSEIDSQLHPD